MEIIKFVGIDKKTSIKKAVDFFYDNLDSDMKIEIFLAKCRVQKDGKTIHFYPNLEINIEKFRKMKQKYKKER